MAAEPTPERQRDVLDRLGIRTPETVDDLEAAAQVVTRQLLDVARALLVPLVALLGLAGGQTSAGFWALLATGAAWQALGLLAQRHRGRRLGLPLLVLVDLVLTGTLLATSGGSDSSLRLLLLVGPVAAGYLLSPRLVGAAGLGVAACYLVVALPDLLGGAPGSVERLALTTIELLYATLAGLAFSWGRDALSRRAATVDAGRRRLLTAELSAEDRERRRVSHDLHGEALQVLLSAAQDLEEADPESLRRARAGIRSGVAVLRETVRDLHPTAVRHHGLEAAVRLALEHRVPEVEEVRVAPEAEGTREGLVLSIVREVGEALAAADPTATAGARVAVEGGHVVVVVRASARAADVIQLRRVLGPVTDWVEAEGGALHVQAGPGGDRVVTVRLRRAGDRRLPALVGDAVRRRSLTLFNALRLLVVPVTAAVGVVGGDPGLAFAAVLAVLAAYYGVVAALGASARWRQVPGTRGAALALVLFAAAVAAQGGITTDLPAVALAFPFLFVLSFTQQQSLRLDGVLAGALAVAAAPELWRGDPGALRAAAVFLAALVWAVVIASLVLAGRQRIERSMVANERSRRSILERSLAAADGERRRLSELVHDGALQELMVAGQDLDAAIAGDAEALAFARVALTAALDQLRDAVAELHPPALEHGGLRPALSAVLDRACNRRGLTGEVHVDADAAGLHDETVVSLVRELVTNVAKHAGAGRVEVRVVRTGDWLELEVADDGVGTTPERLVAALGEGHIGLAAARERVEADGGQLLVASAPGTGTRVRARLPAVGADAAAPGYWPGTTSPVS